MSRFLDRREAGRVLAKKLLKYAGRDDVIVLALPRGGVPIGFEVATALQVPLDVFAVRKIGHPLYEEMAIGAIASGGVEVLDQDAIGDSSVSTDTVRQIIEREQRELARRERLYREGRPFPYLVGKTVILVMTALPLEHRRGAPFTRFGDISRRRSLSPHQSEAPKPASYSRRAQTNACAWKRRSRFTASASGTTTSSKRVTQKCSLYSERQRAREPSLYDRGAACLTNRWCLRTIPRCASRRAANRSTLTSRFPAARVVSWYSPTGVVVVAIVSAMWHLLQRSSSEDLRRCWLIF